MPADLVQSDTGSTLLVTCTNAADGAPIDLTGAAVTLRYTLNGSAIAERAMTIVGDGAAGQASYRWQAGELAPGDLACEVRIEDPAGHEITSLSPLRLAVRPRL